MNAGIDSPTQIFSVDDNAWRVGPYFPEHAVLMTAVQDGRGSFLLVGGYIEDDVLTNIDTLYRFDGDTYEFVLLEPRLPIGARAPGVVFVSQEMV